MRSLAALLFCSGAAALAPAAVVRGVRPAAVSRGSVVQASTFDQATAEFAADFPWLAKYGFGPSVKAERWNGRHAMFGWLSLIHI